MAPNLENIRCFVAAARQQTFRAAARVVALSPAAFSDRIHQLEEQAGEPLFQRDPRRVQLTEAGHRMLAGAARLLDEAERVLASAREGARPPFDLVIGTRFELGMSWLVPALSKLERARPERRLHLLFGDPELLPLVRAGRLDGAVTSARLTLADVRYAQLHEEEYVFVATRRLLRRLPLARAQDASRHVLLDVHADLPLFRYFLDAAPRSEVWAFAHTQVLGTIAAVRHRVLENAGVAVLPKYFVRADLAKRRLVEVRPRARLLRDAFRLVWRADHPRERELHTLAEELRTLPLR